MWIYNKDKSKWEVKSGSLSKSSFDTYKQELSSTRFYAKCLSGATYLPTNDLSDIYDTLKYKDKKNWFIPISSSQYSETPMPIDDATPIESDNSDLYYDKNLTDYNLTLKNKFTPNKLIKDSIDNYYYVDISTTEQIDITDSFLRGKIDGVRLLKGHKILVKDQKTKSSLDSSTDPDTFFLSNYTELEQIGLTTEYEYYSEENGIYEFDGEFLIKVSEFDEYENAFRYSVVTKLGTNVGKQFHLSRLLDGYYPNESEPKEFLEHKNWMIRNKLDYNNICDRNYYESLKHSVQSIDINEISYSIPERTISVGEFGVILNTQSEFGDISNIIKNKFKVDLFSVTETKLFYWTCGQKGTLLRVNKHDFKIEKIKLPKIITSLNCVRFLTDKKGIVVGDFNTILITNDGGNIWEKIDISKFSNFDYNKCIYYSPTKFFVVGENGVFIEFEKSISGFKAYKRRLSKFTERLEDEYLLVDDINDIISANIDWDLEFNGVDTNINDDFIFITTNDNNIIMYDINENFKDFKFLYLDLNNNYGDITNIVKGKSKEVEYEFMSDKFGSTSNDIQYIHINKLFIEYTSLTNFKVGDMINIYGVSDSDIINEYNDIDTTTGLDFTILEIIPPTISSGQKIVFDVYSPFPTLISESTGKSKLIKTPDEFYFSSDTGVNMFSFENFSKLDTTTGIYNIVSITSLNTINPLVNNVVEIDNRYYNDLFNYIDVVSSNEELILTGNESLLKSYDCDINTISLNDIIDSGFYDRNKSKMLFMNYDIASKLNFFRDNGEYRLPEPITFDITSTISDINFLSNIEELNWIDYWKDSLQTFKYNTISGLDESTKVLFSTDFTLKGNTAYKKQILPGDIAVGNTPLDITNVDDIDILDLAPEIDDDSVNNRNRFYGTSTISAPTSTTNSDPTKELFLYKYLMIVRVSDLYPIDVSDVIEISCKGGDGNVIIETNLIVNRIETFGSDNYIYMYTEFNDNIIKSIKENGCDLTNLNKFENYADLENKFNTHPISNAYSLELSGYYDYIDPVITVILDEPTSPNDGDRYLIGFSSSDIPTSSVTGSTWTTTIGGSIVEWDNNSSKWNYYTPEEGNSAIIEQIFGGVYFSYNYQNGQWVEVPFGGNATIKAKFNNKTAYYNLGTTIDTFNNSGSGLLNQSTDSGLKQTSWDSSNATTTPLTTTTTTSTLTTRLMLEWVVYSKVNCTFYMYNKSGGGTYELNSETGSFTFNNELKSVYSHNAYYNDYNDYIYQLSDKYSNVTYTPFNPITNTLLAPIVLGNNGGSGNYDDSDITQDGKIVTLFSGYIETIDTANANTTKRIILSTSYNTIKLFEDKIILKSNTKISLYDNQLTHLWTTTFTPAVDNNNMDIDTSRNEIIITYDYSGSGYIILINISDGSSNIITTGLSSIGDKVKYIKELDTTYIYGEFFGIKKTINILKNGSFNGNVFIHNKQDYNYSLPNLLKNFNAITDMFYNEKNKTMYLISVSNGYLLPCQIKNDELYLMDNDIKKIGNSSKSKSTTGINEIIFSECGGVDGSMWTFAFDSQFNSRGPEINKFEVSNNITDPSIVKMGYTDCFVDFGYSPIYNIYDYLRNINSVLFTPDKEYLAMPVYKNIPLGSLTPSVGYIDTGISNNNKILLGTDLKFEWESVFIDTFVDVDIVAESTRYEFGKVSTFYIAPVTFHNFTFVDGGNGFAYSAPYKSGYILKLNLSDDTITNFGSYTTTDFLYKRGILSPTTGKIYFFPGQEYNATASTATNILVIDPTNDSESLIPWSYGDVESLCITPSGIIYAMSGFDVSYNNLYKINTNTSDITIIPQPTITSITDYAKGVTIYSETGYVYFIPNFGGEFYKLDPIDDTIITIPAPSLSFFVWGVVEKSNHIYAFYSNKIFKIDTSDDSSSSFDSDPNLGIYDGIVTNDENDENVYFIGHGYGASIQLYNLNTNNDTFSNITSFDIYSSYYAFAFIGNSAYSIGQYAAFPPFTTGNPIIKIDFIPPTTYSTEKLLVMDKYYDEPNDAYAIEFHKKIEFDGSDSNILNGNGSLNIISRRKLSQISDDLRILNNIHRTKKSKKITAGSEYFVYDNELTTKIKTNSYTNILLSDQVTKDNLTAVIYTDDTNELSMNILNLDEEINPVVNGIVESNGKVSIIFKDKHNLSEHDLISISYSGDSISTADNGCFPNSSAYDPNFFGSHVISIISPNSILLDIPWNPLYSLNKFTISFTKTDSFLDYTPIDLVDIGVDKKGKTAIELSPENSLFKDNKYELVDVDFNKFRYRLFDGLTINDLIVRYPWILEAEISNAAIGLVNDELTWYSGVWECGRWFEGNWMSGQWMSGDFYGGTWNAKKVIDKKINIEIADKKTIDDESIWHGGRWFDGTWNGGVWRTGRWYAGNFNSGKWLDGIWNDGTFNNGNWNGGIWVLGNWNNGVFNTDNKPSYWIDGKFNGGDFGNGIWYNGTFESKKATARFGTESFNSRPSIWHGGNFVSGSFHSFLDKDDNDNIVRSKIHKYSIWNTGNFISGDFYGGVAYNIDFNGTWHGGILEDIQIIGMDNIIDPLTSLTTGKTLTLNGIFRFNIGNEITIMDKDLNTYKTKVRLPVEEDVNSFTTKVETIPDVGITIPMPFEKDKYKVVSEFNNTNWKSGIWTNGVFNSGLWEGGMFYDGIFNGVSI